jgi:hypothetical protein
MSNREENSQANSFINNSLISTSIVIIYGIFTKGFSLLCTILLASVVSKKSYGLAKVYLEFIYLIILYFPRETIRKTVQKYCLQKIQSLEEEKFKEAIQLCWVLNFLFNFLSMPIFYLFVYNTPSLQDVQVHVLLYVLCANLELLVEPIVLYNNIKFDNTNKLISLTLANYTRLGANYLLCYIFGFDLWSFTLSRLLSTVIYCGYLVYLGLVKYKLTLSSLLPDFKHWSIIYRERPELMEIFYSFVKTNSLKMILTYTEKTILSFFLNLPDEVKAEYSFITDNFSIIIKHVLEPVEENFFNFVNKIKNYNKAEEDFSKHMLRKYLCMMMIFGTLLVGYIFVIGQESIALVYTYQWATESATHILKVYSIYVAIISINGILEAHSNATFTVDQLNRYNNILIIKTFKLIVVSILLSRIDITGLIFANGLAMIIRILVNLYITFGDFRSILKFINSTRYNILTLLSTLACLFVLYNTKNYIKSNYFKVAYGGCIFLFNMIQIYVIEKNRIKEVLKPKIN